MKKVIIRLTENELKKIINESVIRILKEEDSSFVLQIIAQQLSQKGKISAQDGDENTVEVELTNGETAYIDFNVESNPYIQQGMSSNSRDVPDDADEIIDSPKVQVEAIEIWTDDGAKSYQIQDNGIVARTLENIIEIDYDTMDIPSEKDFNYYEE